MNTPESGTVGVQYEASAAIITPWLFYLVSLCSGATLQEWTDLVFPPEIRPSFER
jgi:hypothetical protein